MISEKSKAIIEAILHHAKIETDKQYWYSEEDLNNAKKEFKEIL